MIRLRYCENREIKCFLVVNESISNSDYRKTFPLMKYSIDSSSCPLENHPEMKNKANETVDLNLDTIIEPCPKYTLLCYVLTSSYFIKTPHKRAREKRRKQTYLVFNTSDIFTQR